MQRWQLGPARFDWSEQFIFDLLLDRLQPTFGAPGAALEVLDFAFELLDAILRGPELYTETLCAMVIARYSVKS